MSTSNDSSINLDSETVTIQLTKGYTTIVDSADADLNNLSWHIAPDEHRLYAIGGTRGSKQRRTLRIHRIILERMIGRNLTSKEHVDHIDGDGLNNRRSNLRLATGSQNAGNQHRRITSTSGYKGVSWHKREQKWTARIQLNHNPKWLGYFDTPEEAHAAYCEAAKLYFGEFARFE